MIKTAFIEDYLKNHPGATVHQIAVETGHRPENHIAKLLKAKKLYWRFDLKDGKTKHLYLRRRRHGN